MQLLHNQFTDQLAPILLIQTSLMELNYDARTDILVVKWSDFKEINWFEAEYNFKILRDSIKWYFVKRLLVDSRSLKQIPDRELLERLTALFTAALYGTTIKKFARIQSSDFEREALAEEVNSLINPEDYSIRFRNFNSEIEAIEWLMEHETDLLYQAS